MKKIKPHIIIEIISQDKKVKGVASKKMRRINRFIEANYFQDCATKLSVKYAHGVYNKGIYKNKEDLIYALKVFLE